MRGSGRTGIGSAAGVSGHSLQATRLAGIADDPRRKDRELQRHRQPHRRAEGDPRRSASLRLQCAGCSYPLSPRGPQRWDALGLSMGCRAQARLARKRSAGMNACDICVSGPVPPNGLAGRVAAVDWPRVEADLEAQGAAVIKRLVTPVECHELSALYQRDDTFRSRVVMARHGFGRGEYRYFDYPLPQLVGALRESVYVCLAPVANRWYGVMGMTARFPDRHVDFIARCHAAGQRKATA